MRILLHGIQYCLFAIWQIKDDSWGGVFVDITDQSVGDRSHVKVVLQRSPVKAAHPEATNTEAQVSFTFYSFTYLIKHINKHDPPDMRY